MAHDAHYFSLLFWHIAEEQVGRFKYNHNKSRHKGRKPTEGNNIENKKAAVLIEPD
jgi:hypothetical protein